MLTLLMIGDFELYYVWQGRTLDDLRQNLAVERDRQAARAGFAEDADYAEKQYLALLKSLADWERGEYQDPSLGSWHSGVDSDLPGVYSLNVYEPVWELLVLINSEEVGS